MTLPIVAVVGRPNVGKSTFFNRIIGSRLSIVEDTPGVTRDRIYAEGEWRGRRFALVDTGGIDPNTEDFILSRMREQAQIAMDMSDVIVFIVDGKDGMTADDQDVADLLRRTGKKVILVVNKIDKGRDSGELLDFYSLGIGEPIPISAANMTGLGDALDEIIENLPDSEGDEEDDDTIRVAVIGKPNVGKSSLINALLGENRVIVSETAGTTRDSIDTPFEYEGTKFVLIDTAGIRRRSRVNEDIERYSIVRAIGAIERSHVCLLMIDAADGITEQDKKIAGLAHDAGKGVIIVINKWDLIEKETGTLEEYTRRLKKELPFMSYAPELFISVKTGQRVEKIFEMVEEVSNNCSVRISTGRLNSLMQDIIMMKEPPTVKGKRLKIYYVTQVSVRPPLFSFQINSRKLLHFSYSRYIENRLREHFGFEGTSIKFVFREKGENE